MGHPVLAGRKLEQLPGALEPAFVARLSAQLDALGGQRNLERDRPKERHSQNGPHRLAERMRGVR